MTPYTDFIRRKKNTFKKGHKGYWLGKKRGPMSLESRMKLSRSVKEGKARMWLVREILIQLVIDRGTFEFYRADQIDALIKKIDFAIPRQKGYKEPK